MRAAEPVMLVQSLPHDPYSSTLASKNRGRTSLNLYIERTCADLHPDSPAFFPHDTEEGLGRNYAPIDRPAMKTREGHSLRSLPLTINQRVA
jgi:hypothetical protein